MSGDGSRDQQTDQGDTGRPSGGPGLPAVASTALTDHRRPGGHADTHPDSDSLDDRPELVLDEFDEKLEAFNALRKSDAAAADRILDQVGATDGVDRQIIPKLASKRPLGHPIALGVSLLTN